MGRRELPRRTTIVAVVHVVVIASMALAVGADEGVIRPLPGIDDAQPAPAAPASQFAELSQRLDAAQATLAELKSSRQAAASRSPNVLSGDGGPTSGASSSPGQQAGIDPSGARQAEESEAADDRGPVARLASLLQDQPLERGVLDRINDLAQSLEGLKKQYPLVRLSGFLQTDYDAYQQDAASHAILGDVQNGAGIRRARLQALGKVTEFTNFSVEFDFANAGRPSFFDVWGEQMNLPTGALRVGQFRQPVTMDSWTSVRHLEFMERSAPFTALDPFRRVGAMNWWVSEDQRMLAAASVYATGGTFFNTTSDTTQYSTYGDDRFGTEIGDNGGIACATRATRLVYYDDLTDRQWLHVGGGYNFAQIGGNGPGAAGWTGSQTWRATTTPELFVGDSGGSGSAYAGTPNVLDTGRILAHNYQLIHGELAGNYGSAHFQTEWLGEFVDQYVGPPLFYQGAYAQGGYFLTGETAGYNKLTGVMDYNVRPFNEFLGLGPWRGLVGWGAWEVATRWSYLNLQNSHVNPVNYQNVTSLTAPNGGAGPSTAYPNPGILNNATLALNWWWNQWTRVEFNYVVTMLDSQYHGYSRMEAWATRFQVEF